MAFNCQLSHFCADISVQLSWGHTLTLLVVPSSVVLFCSKVSHLLKSKQKQRPDIILNYTVDLTKQPLEISEITQINLSLEFRAQLFKA